MSEKKEPTEGVKQRSFNPNYIGLGLLVVAFVASLIDILRPDLDEGEQVVDERDIVHVLHWQLEPGFREAMDAVIEDYNNLPHVREAGYKVEQMAVTERVYSQFLNVHLISGTAPDLAALGMAKMANNRAQFFEPYLEVLEEPNPYNADAYMPDDVDPELREFLQTAPWKETFINGLQSSFDRNLGYYYTIPVAAWGTIRFYYNKKLMRQVKALIREGFAADRLPEWMARVLDPDPNETPGAFLPDSPELREWVAHDGSPETFGQLVLLNEACLVYAREYGRDKLVPIAGSSYSRDLFANTYNTPFFYAWEDRLDFDKNSRIESNEVLAGYDQDRWDFEDPRLKAFYNLQRKLATYFPVGFLGLDREQANRRFILGNALFLATGAWDAAGIFMGAANRLEEEDRFEVGVIPFPLPAENERWGQFEPMPQSEASYMDGVPLGLYKFSDHKEEAIDFLHYITSYSANGKLVREAGWLPIVIGSETIPSMEPFLPIVEGVYGGLKFGFEGTSQIQTIYNGQYLLLISNDIDYATFTERVIDALENEQNGIDRQWYERFRRDRENTRGIERSLSLQRFNQLLEGDISLEKDRYRQVLDQSSGGLSGLKMKHNWHLFGYERPFPEE